MQSHPLLQLGKDFISLFYPNYCVGCSESLVRGEEIICTRCILEMPQTQSHEDSENPLLRRMSGRIPVAEVLAAFRFTKRGRIQKVLHALKYKNNPEIGIALGRFYGQKLKDSNKPLPFDLIIPVPLHDARLRKRGYNQSAKFAEGLAEKLNIPLGTDVVSRNVRTSTQTRKTKVERWENVARVFKVVSPPVVTGKHILLVDDVVTTGATIEACGSVLVQSGARLVSIACIAVA